MDLIDRYHALTSWMVATVGGSDMLVHTHAGLLIYSAALFALRTRRASWRAVQIVLLLEIANELADRLFFGAWRWGDTLADIAATLAWPLILYLLGQYRRTRWAKWYSEGRAARLDRAEDYPRLAALVRANGPHDA